MTDADHMVFLSYSAVDRTFADRLTSDLEAAGVRVWIDREGIRGGATWHRVIQQAIHDASTMIVVLTPASVSSNNVDSEWQYALDDGDTVIPIIAEACAVPLPLVPLHHIDFTASYEQGLARLVSQLTGAKAPTVTARPGPSVEPVATEASRPANAGGGGSSFVRTAVGALALIGALVLAAMVIDSMSSVSDTQGVASDCDRSLPAELDAQDSREYLGHLQRIMRHGCDGDEYAVATQDNTFELRLLETFEQDGRTCRRYVDPAVAGAPDEYACLDGNYWRVFEGEPW